MAVNLDKLASCSYLPNQGGYIIIDSILYLRCPYYYDYIGTYERSIKKSGNVDKDVICPSCNQTMGKTTLKNLDLKKDKEANEQFVE